MDITNFIDELSNLKLKGIKINIHNRTVPEGMVIGLSIPNGYFRFITCRWPSVNIYLDTDRADLEEQIQHVEQYLVDRASYIRDNSFFEKLLVEFGEVK